MRPFSEAHRAVHFPLDRRFHVWIRSKEALIIALVVVVPVAIAWIQFWLFGLPNVSISPPRALPSEPYGFPAWIRLTHFVNFFFLMLLARSGLSILMDHPRLYWNRNCTPKTGKRKRNSLLRRSGSRRVSLSKLFGVKFCPLFGVP
jgi:sulfoxide reductase catalytic subunit YedY